MDGIVYNIGGRRFLLSPFVPAVEERLWKTVQGLLRDLPKEKEEQILTMQIDKNKSMMDYIDLLGGFVIENQCKILACIITPEGTSEQDKNLSDIAKFLAENLRFLQKYRILSDFFMSEDAACALSLIMASVPKAAIILEFLFPLRFKQ